MGERASLVDEPEAIEVTHEAPAMRGRREEMLGLRFQEMRVQPHPMALGEVAGHLEQAWRAALRPVDPEKKIDAPVDAPPSRDQRFYHLEIPFGRRTLRRAQALAQFLRQRARIDRQRI